MLRRVLGLLVIGVLFIGVVLFFFLFLSISR
jgi:hypothetical protein